MPQSRPVHGEIYRHFKNKFYQVIEIATHSETGEKLVIYQALYGEFQVYARPYDMFISEVDHEKYPEVTAKYRFTLINGVGPVEASKANMQVYETIEGPDDTKVAEPVEHTKLTVEDMILDVNSEETKKIFETKTDTESDDLSGINPQLLEFLDADSIDEKYQIVKQMSLSEVTDSMIDTMAVSLDVVIREGDTQDRLQQLLTVLRTRGQYELSRFRS